MPRQQYAPQASPRMQIPELDWSQHPANQPIQQSSQEPIDWKKMFGGKKPMEPTSPEQIAANSAVGGGFGMDPAGTASPPSPSGGSSVGAMAAEGAKGGGGALKAIGSAISGF